MTYSKLGNRFAYPARSSLAGTESLEVEDKVFFMKGVQVRDRVNPEQTSGRELPVPDETVFSCEIRL